MKGVFSFSFRVESDIAPTAQLLIYTVLPNGEIVADTQKLKIENCFANKVGVLFKSFHFIQLPFGNMENKNRCTLKYCHTVLLKLASIGPWKQRVMPYLRGLVEESKADCHKHNFLSLVSS